MNDARILRCPSGKLEAEQGAEAFQVWCTAPARRALSAAEGAPDAALSHLRSRNVPAPGLELRKFQIGADNIQYSDTKSTTSKHGLLSHGPDHHHVSNDGSFDNADDWQNQRERRQNGEDIKNL